MKMAKRAGAREIVTQSELARRRGVSRQAIHRLIAKGRISLRADGLIDVRQAEMRLAIPRPMGRPKKSG